jgi:hypothetical protein
MIMTITTIIMMVMAMMMMVITMIIMVMVADRLASRERGYLAPHVVRHNVVHG